MTATSATRRLSAVRSSATLWIVVGAVALIAVWEAIVRGFDVAPRKILAPSQIVATFLDDPGLYLGEAWSTAQHLAIGIAIALVVASLLGAVLATFRPLEYAAQPLLVLIMVTPWVAYITSIVLVFGLGRPSILFLTAFVTVPAFVYATVGGLRSADPAARELFASIDASRWEVFWRLRLPSAMPSLFTAARFNVGLGLGAAYFAEGGAGGQDGLGNLGRRAIGANDGEALWTTILCAAVLGLVAQLVVVALERWLLRWHHSQR